MRKPTVFSLFSGCGGLDLGFKLVDFELVYACDNDPAAVDCYRRNLDANAVVRSVHSPEFIDDINSHQGVDVVLGGFPCQGFSKAGPKKESDPRNSLYQQMKNAVGILRPAVFVAENVDGLSQNFGGVFIDRICDEFAELGYEVEFRILQALEFGVPQYRRRIIFVGKQKQLKANFIWPTPTHKANNRNGEFKIQRMPLFELSGDSEVHSHPVSIADAISDLRSLTVDALDHKVTNAWPKKYEHVFGAINEGQKLCNVRHSKTSVYTWQIPEVFGKVTKREKVILETIGKNRRHKIYGDIPNGNPLSVDCIEQLSSLNSVDKDVSSLLEKGYLKAIDGKYDLKGAMFCSGLFKRPNWKEPAPTVLTNFHNPRYFLHPLEDRPFTLRECARLQSFPDDFEICSESVDLVSGYRVIGNAVPPGLATRIAECVHTLIKRTSRSRRNTNETTVSATHIS
jgi:DNA (cytosine-5)-methyltransferase 1